MTEDPFSLKGDSNSLRPSKRVLVLKLKFLKGLLLKFRLRAVEIIRKGKKKKKAKKLNNGQ